MSLSRRHFIGSSALAGLGVLIAGCTDDLSALPSDAGYGPLLPDPAGRLALPGGFRYRIVAEAGVTTLDAGEPTPGNADGAGAFPTPAGGTLLVTNHELREPLAATPMPVPHRDGLVYDPGCAAGCTVVEVDRDGARVREVVALAGTSTNCAGGVTPWGTWLSCEETELLAGQDGATRDHGYVFEVAPADVAANRAPKPVTVLGRFAHEAAAVDPRSADIYLTEDAARPSGLLYRWTAPADLRRGVGALGTLPAGAGTLAAMSCADAAQRHVDDLSRATEPGTSYAVRWLPVPDRDARGTATRRQFADADVTRARKLEGAWWGGDGVFVVSSYARSESPVPHDGQVWFLDPGRATITLRLRFGAGDAFDGPDNITVSPYGGLIIAEDGGGSQHLIGMTASGATFALADNQASGKEFAGPVFSADRRILFANVLSPGTTYAITGPWR